MRMSDRWAISKVRERPDGPTLADVRAVRRALASEIQHARQKAEIARSMQSPEVLRYIHGRIDAYELVLQLIDGVFMGAAETSEVSGE
jgi:hypothetical protein